MDAIKQMTLDEPRRFEATRVRDEILAGSEKAFEQLFHELFPRMLRIARSFVRDPFTAEDVVQETWLAVLTGISRFQARSTLETWIFAILANRARSRARAQHRTRPISSLCESELEMEQLARVAQKFPEGRLSWMTRRGARERTPEQALLAKETTRLVLGQLRSLPCRQAEVVRLRDIECRSASEVCEALGLSESNQKVLLHRGRGRIRRAMAAHRTEGGSGGENRASA